jgi:P pilus assembly chaperone PapD
MCLALALALAVASAGAVSEPLLVITPPLVEIAADQPWADVAVRNTNQVPWILRSTAFAWEQDERGTVILDAAEDVFAFPARVTLRPGEVRKFRVSVVRPPGERERAYRLALDVSAPHAEDATRVLVPVFVAPSEVARDLALGVTCGPKACRVALANLGTVRARPERMSLLVADASGRRTIHELKTWWVLAGGSRILEVEVPELEPSARVVVRAEVEGRELQAEAGGKTAQVTNMRRVATSEAVRGGRR